MNVKKIISGSIIGTGAFFALAFSAFAINFIQGFEVDTSGWNNFGGTITRVSSGTDGITSSEGNNHAVIDGSVYTQWGGYTNAFPSNGYITELDVYFDMGENTVLGTDKRFDFSSAINNPAGSHRRDFIFNIGTNPTTVGEWVVSASNNAPGWPSNPGSDPFAINTTGWYTLRHTFQDNGSGVLEVVMDLVDSSDTVLHSWTLSDPSDVIGSTVGGNRYGWFTSQRFDFDSLAIDNAEKMDIVPVVGPPADKNECKSGGWMTFNSPVFKNQGDCVSYVSSNENASGNKNK